jgi:endonuclease III
MMFLCAIGIYSQTKHTLKNNSQGRKRHTQTQTTAQTVLDTLRGTLPLPKLVKVGADPFQTLVVTIMSQNTADTNTERAYQKLQERFQITPEVLSKAKIGDIEDCIRVAGLYQSKAKAIQTASKIVLEKFGGNLNAVLSLPVEEARKTLMEMPGVGPKTADVVLLFSAGKPTIPVDTHVNRVSKRLGLAPAKGDYEAIRKSLQSHYQPQDYALVHMLLIAHGRKTCKAQKPLCNACPVSSACPSKGGSA